MTPRRYELKRRAERQAETRRRIVEAVVALHREVGPARTTISAIAERAGVERLTVYRHFADDSALYAACSAHFRAETRTPDPGVWADVGDPAERLRATLLEFYGYYGRGEEMLGHLRRDAPRIPALAAVVAPWGEFVESVRTELLERWGVHGAARARLSAVLAHALRFETWQSLAREEALGDAAAADLMVGLARVAGGTDRSAHG
ncbi:MAG TPA: TetR/AcrR family transcriptional regulator [Longimicrobiaceae bacterium]|nr:TetR/AcrR family transcriptional regulator [Longimicrobiaceae bacterium]